MRREREGEEERESGREGGGKFGVPFNVSFLGFVMRTISYTIYLI